MRTLNFTMEFVSMESSTSKLNAFPSESFYRRLSFALDSDWELIPPQNLSMLWKGGHFTAKKQRKRKEKESDTYFETFSAVSGCFPRQGKTRTCRRITRTIHSSIHPQ